MPPLLSPGLGSKCDDNDARATAFRHHGDWKGGLALTDFGSIVEEEMMTITVIVPPTTTIESGVGTLILFSISALLDIDANKGGGGKGDNGHDDDGVLLSQIVLPSHVLMDGQFVRLPPLLALERVAFFEWAIASCCLINDEGEEGGGEGENKENWGRMGCND